MQPEAFLEFLNNDFNSRFKLTEAITTIGRNSTNTIVLAMNEKDLVVSGIHAEIRFEGADYLIKDLNSTNGTYLNSEPVKKSVLTNGDIISFGKKGPKAKFVFDTFKEEETRKTVFQPGKNERENPAPQFSPWLKKLTKIPIKDYLTDSRILISVFVVLVVIFILLTLIITDRKIEELSIYENQIIQLEDEIKNTKDIAQRQFKIEQYNKLLIERDILMKRLNKNPEDSKDFIEKEIIKIFENFKADHRKIPPYFISKVNYYIEKFANSNRDSTIRAFTRAKNIIPIITEILEEKDLPRDLAYLPFVESAFDPEALNPKSKAKGLWQLLVPTAREYGLKITDSVDERTDIAKSTIAAREYLLDLISVFGLSSFTLVLASYNYGDANIRFRLKQIDNPIHDRDYWALSELGILPMETLNYVPQFIAILVIINNKEKFGFTANL